ncbi:MAG TPA: RDD family protein [Usitatibacter sp.]|jgi:uncharacterized RDD family membrane protein YckC/Tfp pilus assembly major pilin PilA|nr:RDD family protein [Usitatibacter sp.]
MHPVLAGFWRRAAALFVDVLILFIPQSIINLLLAGAPTVGMIINIVLTAAYFVAFHSSAKMATPGKMAFGIKVTTLDGNRLGVPLAIGRYFATWLSTLIVGIGYLMAAFTERKQALHDMLCKTLVVNKAVTPADMGENSDTMPITAGVIAVAVIWVAAPIIATGAALVLPAYQERAMRSQVGAVVGSVEPFKKEVVDAIASRRPIPAGKRNVASPLVDNVTIEPSGQITMNLAKDRAGGGKIFFAPLASKGGIVEWRCWSEGTSEAVLTAACAK